MAFNTTVFSTDGLNLLAQLSVTKSLRIKHIYVDETEHAASDFNQSPSWWAEQTNLTMIKVRAELSAAGVISDQARLVVKLSQTQGEVNPVMAKTIVITACGVENGIESTEITFCGISDSTGVEVLFKPGIKLSTSVAIYFAFNNASTITFEDNINPDYVIHSELDRFVSCHPIGDPTGGEEQTIGGIKTFRDGAVINMDDGCNLSFMLNNSQQGYIGDTGTTGLHFKSTTTSFGDTCFKFSNNYTPIITISRSDTNNRDVYSVAIDGDVSVSENLTAKAISSESLVTGSCKIVDTTLISMYSGLCINGNFIPDTNSTRYLGLPSSQWLTIYGYEIKATSGFVMGSDDAVEGEIRISASSGDVEITGFKDGYGLSLGQVYNPSTGTLGDRAPIYCGEVSATSVYASGDIQVEGSIKGHLDGVIPVPSSETDIPIGSICVLESDKETKRGDQFCKTSDEQGWMNMRTSEKATLTFSDLEATSYNIILNYNSYTRTTRFMALSHGGVHKPFLAIRTA